MDRKEEALKVFESGFNCSQAVLSVFCEELNCDRDLALKISTGFGGGIRIGEVCGAVSGAVMALGLKYGHTIEGDTETKSKAYSLTKEFINRFEEKNGTIVCKKLLGYDLSNQEEYEYLLDKGIFKNMCPVFIKDAIDILDAMFSE
ncbi:MAG TPA: C_GCAxxG_C_C family protein [Epulopiscium sp.]|nr:C_GCAxxG_C_C family protein [Candidatus Epulonipiscium sp.]